VYAALSWHLIHACGVDGLENASYIYTTSNLLDEHWHLLRQYLLCTSKESKVSIFCVSIPTFVPVKQAQ
jgi:hypothetical protein